MVRLFIFYIDDKKKKNGEAEEMESDFIEESGDEEKKAESEEPEAKEEPITEENKGLGLSSLISDAIGKKSEEIFTDSEANETKESENEQEKVNEEKNENNEENVEKEDNDDVKEVTEDAKNEESNEEKQIEEKENNVQNEEKSEKQENEEPEKQNEEADNTKQEENSEVIIISDENSKDEPILSPEDKDSDEMSKSITQSIIDKLEFPKANIENEESKENQSQEDEIKETEPKERELSFSKIVTDTLEKKEESQEEEKEVSEFQNENKEENNEKKEETRPSLQISQSIIQEEVVNNEEDDSVMVTAVKSQPKIPIYQPLYSDEELSSAYKKLITKKTLPQLEMRPSLIEYGRKQSIQHTMLEEYDAAQADDNAVELLQQSLNEDNKNFSTEQEKRTIKDRIDEVNREEKEIEEKYKTKINDAKKANKASLDKLMMDQEQERKRFEEKWSSEEAVIPYSKPSSQVLQIKRMQKAMALAHEFQKAKQLKLQAEKLQKEEAVIASKQAAEAMKAQYILLVENQQRQVECMREHWERVITVLECQRDAEINSLENTKKQLLTRSTTKPKKPQVIIPQVTSRDARGSSGLITQRTRSQFATYKRSAEKSKLDVKPLDVKTLIRPLTASPRKSQTQRLNTTI